MLLIDSVFNVQVVSMQEQGLGELFGDPALQCNPKDISSIHLVDINDDGCVRGFSNFSEVFISQDAVKNMLRDAADRFAPDARTDIAKIWLSTVMIRESSHVYMRRSFNDLNARGCQNAADTHQDTGEFMEIKLFGHRRNWASKSGAKYRTKVVAYARAFVAAIETGEPLPLCDLPIAAARGTSYRDMAMSYVPPAVIFM